MAQTFDSVAAVLGAVGRDLGATDWIEVTQQRIDTFAQQQTASLLQPQPLLEL